MYISLFVTHGRPMLINYPCKVDSGSVIFLIKFTMFYYVNVIALNQRLHNV